jgi:hypothetical protein
MGRKRKEPKEKKRKSVAIIPIVRENAGKVTEPYRVMESMIGKHHKQLNEAEARIALAWDGGPAKPDTDGYVKFGRVKRGADLDRAYSPFDIWIIIRREVWNSFDETRKRAEMDRLLCRCDVTRDSHGEVVVDELGRSVFRLRKPIEVFPENVARFGFHQEPKLADCLARFNDSQRPLFKEGDKKKGKGFSEPAMGPKDVPKEPAKKSPKAKAESNGHAETNGTAVSDLPWRNRPVTVLDKLPFPIQQALQNAKCGTLGAIAELEESQGALGLAEIKDMGSERAEMLRDLIAKYRIDHAPELAAEESAATS